MKLAKNAVTLHWLLSNMIVGTIAIAMLSSTPALAVKQPNRLPPECPPDCNNREDRSWQTAMARHVGVANLAYTQHGVVPKNELLYAAQAMTAYANARQIDGTLMAAQIALVGALKSGVWNTIELNALAPFNKEQPFNNVVTEAYLQSLMNSITPTERGILASIIEIHGLEWAMQESAAILTQFAAAEATRIPGQALLLPVRISPGAARAVFDTLELAGTILALSDPIGWVIIGGAFAGKTWMNYNGM